VLRLAVQRLDGTRSLSDKQIFLSQVLHDAIHRTGEALERALTGVPAGDSEHALAVDLRACRGGANR
jgi:hypothetical protein